MIDRIPAHITTHDWRAIEALLRRLLLAYSDGILTVTLFGSKARGDDASGSDIDVLVVVADEDWTIKHEIRTLGARISLDYDVLFNLYVIEQERWLWMGEINHPLHRRIRNEGVELTPVATAGE
jgi:predicted nucleotidyltransferase